LREFDLQKVMQTYRNNLTKNDDSSPARLLLEIDKGQLLPGAVDQDKVTSQGVGVALFKRPRYSFRRLSVGIRVVSEFVHAGGGAGHLTAVMSVCLHVHSSVVCTLMSPSCGVTCCAARYGRLAAGRGTILRHCQRSAADEQRDDREALWGVHFDLRMLTPHSPRTRKKRS
jgi:hypothetical protein